jgi:hypothetical protein
MAPHPRTIALFDVDGTLTVPRKVRAVPGRGTGERPVGWPAPASRPPRPPQEATEDMLAFLQELRKVRPGSGRGREGALRRRATGR